MTPTLRTLPLFIVLLLGLSLQAAVIWVEGEKPSESTMNRHPWWYDKVKKDQLSGGDLISNFNDQKIGEAEYVFMAPAAGDFEFFIRANPVAAKLSYRLGDGKWTSIDLEKRLGDNLNIAEDGKIDLRFVSWIRIGTVKLSKGATTIRFRMDSQNHNHGMIDCFVLTNEPFEPRGALKPGEAPKPSEDDKGFIAFAPPLDPLKDDARLDLRYLNERFAGEGGYIAAKNGQFVHSKTGQSVRFWAVNGPPHSLKDPKDLRRAARILAKRGVNLVRVHGGLFDKSDGSIKPDEVQQRIAIVEAMKAEGIYVHFSIYFPLWMNPKPGLEYLKGYDGNKHPFAALQFNPEFQKVYQGWWKALLTTPGPSGKRLIDDPAIMGLEIQNEDSYFFWTFDAKNIPDEQLRILETQFGAWLKKKHGSLEAAQAAWKNQKHPRDNPPEGRMGFRPLWNMVNEKTARDKDTVAFLAEAQRNFYAEQIKFLRELGYKGMITPSNWYTASPEILGPVERYTYNVGDFIDRHGYFGCFHKGDNSGWSLRDGHTWADRSALRFDPEEPGKPKAFSHPAIEITYDNKPTMISETTYNRPNRYRSEAPIYYAAYGALQDTDCVVHFALDGMGWNVKPGFWMQPWTLMSPAMMGQFPAAALLYRKGLVAPGDVLADVSLSMDDLMNLKGTPLPQEAHFDELRLKDVPAGTEVKPGQRLDPLLHFAGRANVKFVSGAGGAKLSDLKPLIDRNAQTVLSSHKQLKLDYGKGVLTINAPMAQGAIGNLKAAGIADLKDLSIDSDLDLVHVLAVALDDKPLSSSGRILLQAMSEERNGSFKAEGEELKRVISVGRDPWMIKPISGTVKLKRADAAQLQVTALDHNGYATKEVQKGSEFKLRPETLYYLISR